MYLLIFLSCRGQLMSEIVLNKKRIKTTLRFEKFIDHNTYQVAKIKKCVMESNKDYALNLIAASVYVHPCLNLMTSCIFQYSKPISI